jgi:hypothetical protein
VSLAVYGPRGARLKELRAGTLAAGEYAARWDGCDDRGAPVGSGVYFYRLSAGGETLTGRLAVVR